MKVALRSSVLAPWRNPSFATNKCMNRLFTGYIYKRTTTNPHQHPTPNSLKEANCYDVKALPSPPE
jgi:hypothetical protein